MSLSTNSSVHKTTEGKAAIYVNIAILVVVMLLLGYFILTRQGDSAQTGVSKPGTQQAGTGIVPRSINTERVLNFANSIQNFSLKQNSYEQAQISLFNSGTVTGVGTESINEGGNNYTRFLKLKNDEGEELAYRFTEFEANSMLVILSQQGAGGGVKITFSDIEAGDDVSVQRVIDLLEDSRGDGYTITVRRQ